VIFFHNLILWVLNYLILSTIYKKLFPCWFGGSLKACNCLLETLMDFHGDSTSCITLQLLLTHHHLIINWFVDNMYYVVFLYCISFTHSIFVLVQRHFNVFMFTFMGCVTLKKLYFNFNGMLCYFPRCVVL
jgi:hypothetical protein